MNRKSLLCISIILLIVAVDFSYGQESRRRGDDKQTTTVPITLQQDVGNAGSNQGGLILTSLQGGSTARSDQRSGVKGSFGSQDGDKEDKDFGPQDGDKEDKDFGQRSGVKGSFGPQDGDKEDKDFGQRSGVKGNFGPQDGGKVVKGSLKIKGLGKESFKTKGVDKGAKDYSKDYGYGVGDPYPSYGGSKKGYNGGGLDGYYGDDGYGGKGIIGYEGKDPREHGKDIADFGPIYGSLNNMTSKLNVWICAVHDWRQKGRYGSSICGSNKYYSNKYDSDNYDSDEYGSDKYGSDKYGSDKYGSRNNYQNNQRRKRSYNKVTFPVKQVKNYKKFPFFRFPPLISIAPWLPIFYDKLTYQTFIFSLTGGLYIIPPLINFYGQRFAVAQLIKWGYASLVSSGVPPPPAVNVAPLVQPGPPPPPPAGGPAPKYEKGAVKTDYPEFRPRPDYLQKTVNDGPKDQGPGPYSG